MTGKDLAEVVAKPLFQLFSPRDLSQDLVQANHFHAAQAAGHDMLETLKLAGVVQGQPVRGHPAAGAYADRGQLAQAPPQTGKPLAALHNDVPVGTGSDGHFFQVAQVAVQIASPLFQF